MEGGLVDHRYGIQYKDISNEKNKQKKILQPNGTSFAGVENLKSWNDQTDKYLIYKISINEEYVYKTSKQKRLLGNDMDSRLSHYLNNEFCYFDGKVGRVKDFITLTASVYHTPNYFGNYGVQARRLQACQTYLESLQRCI